MTRRKTQSQFTRRPRKSAGERERGVAMVLVLVALTMATIIGVAFMSAQQTTTGIAENVNKQAKARGIAESALVMVSSHIETNEDWREEFVNGTWASDVSASGGTFTVTVEDGVIDDDGSVSGDGQLNDDNADKVVITAIGKFNGVTHTIKAEVTPSVSEQIVVNVLMVVPNPNSLASEDQARKELIESWGWNVTLIDASDSQEDFDQAVAENDVVFVVENVSSGNVNDKLTEAPIGVVTEESYLVDDLGIGADGMHYDGTTITIHDNTHYITEVFSANQDVTLVNSTQELGAVSGLYPIGLLPLGKKYNDTEPALGAMDAGQTLQDGTVSTARRVVLPWAGNDFDFDEVTEDTKTILKRSLYWASLSPVVTANQVGLAVTEEFYLPDEGLIDSYNSALGFYGGDNVGSAAVITTNSTSSNMIRILDDAVVKGSAYVGPGGNPSSVIDVSDNGQITGAKATLTEEIPMPEITTPEGLPSSSGDLTYTSGTTVISSDVRCGYFSVRNDAIIQISGDITIFCDDYFEMKGNSKLQLLEGASLKLYAKGINGEDAIHFEGNAQFNANTQEPGRATMFIMSNGEMDMDDSPYVYSRVIAPNGSMDVNDDTHFFGTFLGRFIVVEQRGQLHHAIDISPYYDGAPTVVDEGGEEETTPTAIVEYLFNEIPLPVPSLIGHWKLDETVTASGGGAGAVRVKDRIEMDDDGIIDSYDSTVGTSDKGSAAIVTTNSTSSDRVTLEDDSIIKGSVYVGHGGNHWHVIDLDDDGTITGDRDDQDSNYVFPDIDLPSGFPSSSGDVTITNNTTWSSDKRVDKLEIKSDGKLTISGNIKVRVDDEFKVDDEARIELADGASVDFYCYDKVTFKGDDSEINKNTGDPSRMYVYVMSGDDVKLDDDADVHCHLVAPDSDVEITSWADLYGSLICDDLKLVGSGDIHVDISSGGGGGDSGTVTAEDSSDYVNNGTYEGGVVSTESGQDAGAMYFEDGEDGYVEVPHSDAYLLSNGTVTFWFKATDLGGHQGMFSKDSKYYDDGGHLHIYLDGNVVKARLQGSSSSNFVTSSTISENTWHHVALSWGDGGMTLFIDGVEEDTNSYTGGITGNTEPIAFGSNTWDSDDDSVTPLHSYFIGYMDDVRIYNQGFDATQATTVMNGGDPAAGSGTGKIVKDTSGYGEPLDLEIDNTSNVSWVDSGGLTFNSATKAMSQNPATKVHTALTESDAFTLEVKFTTSDITQNGPARIVSMSSGSSNRNFTFGQDDEAYLMRLRTGETGSNGTPDMESSDVLATDTLQHVIVVFDGEYVKMWRNGTLEITEARGGTLDSWADSHYFMLGNESSDDAPWLGTLHKVTLYDQALNSLQVGDVFAGNPPRANEDNDNMTFNVRWYENP